jgi:hypothetical protein
MARHESNREDLLRDATALVQRVEIAPISGRDSANIVAGFRPDGAASIFFGADPVYHFNAAGEVRRAFCDELLYKATHGRLVSLRRVRHEQETLLFRHELSQTEQLAFFTKMRSLFAELAAMLIHGKYKVIGQVPDDADVVGRLKVWLAHWGGTRVADTPHAVRRGK